jgi:hypothetical protein
VGKVPLPPGETAVANFSSELSPMNRSAVRRPGFSPTGRYECRPTSVVGVAGCFGIGFGRSDAGLWLLEVCGTQMRADPVGCAVGCEKSYTHISCRIFYN